MVATSQEAYNEITTYIAKQGGAYSGWYCGITSDQESRLFGDHNVPRQDHWFIVADCGDSASARAVEKALLNLGCDGGAGGGDVNSRFAYAYLKTHITNP